jgi:hypothetical protein
VRFISERRLVYVMAALVALALGRDLLHMPLQVYDCVSVMIKAAQAPSAWEQFYSHLHSEGYFRPVFYSEVKLLLDLSNGNYFLTYRLFHAFLIFAFLMLFARALDVRDRWALVVAPFALTVFVGMHTFIGTVKELYPVNHFLQVAVLTLAAINLAQTRGGWLIDLLSVLTFTVAALTLESGLLVWVVFVTAWLVGMPGVSRRGLATVTVLVGAYVLVRFGLFGTGLPGVDERSAGFGLQAIDPPEIARRFGDNMLPFYAYNVGSSIMSVLFAEPRSGVWVLVRDLLNGYVRTHTQVNLVAAFFATGLLVAYVVSRVRSGSRWPVTLTDQQLAVFTAVLLANAAISYAYTKDEIVSSAGALYALPVAGAAVYFLRRWDVRRPSRRVLALACTIALIGSGAWMIRALGVHQVLRTQAFVQRNDWARLEDEWRRNGRWQEYAEAGALPMILQLRDEAIAARVVNPRFNPGWVRLFDESY